MRDDGGSTGVRGQLAGPYTIVVRARAMARMSMPHIPTTSTISSTGIRYKAKTTWTSRINPLTPVGCPSNAPDVRHAPRDCDDRSRVFIAKSSTQSEGKEPRPGALRSRSKGSPKKCPSPLQVNPGSKTPPPIGKATIQRAPRHTIDWQPVVSSGALEAVTIVELPFSIVGCPRTLAQKTPRERSGFQGP